MSEFQINFDRDPAVFFPGEKVIGNFKLNIPDGFKARKIRIEMIGKAYTFWEGEANNNTKIKNTDIVRIRHNCADHKGKIVYIQDEIIVWKSEDSKNDLKSGKHLFTFAFRLPQFCPPSFESRLGFIRYFIKTEIDRPWKFDDKFIKCFTVLPKIDLNQIPNAKMIGKKQEIEEIGNILWKKGIVKFEVQIQHFSRILENKNQKLKVKIEKQGYVCGEQIKIELKIDNQSSKEFNKIFLKLAQRVTYTGFRDGFVESSKTVFDEKKSIKNKTLTTTKMNSQIRVEERIFSEEIMTFLTEKNSTKIVEKYLKIPSVSPSVKTCNLIDIDYLLKVKLISSGIFKTILKIEIPFIIGTDPINCEQNYEMEYKYSVFGFCSTHLKKRNLEVFNRFKHFCDSCHHFSAIRSILSSLHFF